MESAPVNHQGELSIYFKFPLLQPFRRNRVREGSRPHLSPSTKVLHALLPFFRGSPPRDDQIQRLQIQVWDGGFHKQRDGKLVSTEGQRPKRRADDTENGPKDCVLL